MFKKKIILFLLLLLPFIFSQTVYGEKIEEEEVLEPVIQKNVENKVEFNIPPPPEGYEWQYCEEVNGRFLKPKGWFFRKDILNGTKAYFISKEEIIGEGKFSTGLSINVITEIQKRSGFTPSLYAANFLKQAMKAKAVEKVWSEDFGPFAATGFSHPDSKADHQFYMSYLLAANEKSGTLYLMYFEAPQSEWEEAVWEAIKRLTENKKSKRFTRQQLLREEFEQIKEETQTKGGKKGITRAITFFHNSHQQINYIKLENSNKTKSFAHNLRVSPI